MAEYALSIMRIGLGIVFLWFGALKYFPGLSPAEDLVRSTIYFVDPDFFYSYSRYLGSIDRSWINMG